MTSIYAIIEKSWSKDDVMHLHMLVSRSIGKLHYITVTAMAMSDNIEDTSVKTKRLVNL